MKGISSKAKSKKNIKALPENRFGNYLLISNVDTKRLLPGKRGNLPQSVSVKLMFPLCFTASQTVEMQVKVSVFFNSIIFPAFRCIYSRCMRTRTGWRKHMHTSTVQNSTCKHSASVPVPTHTHKQRWINGNQTGIMELGETMATMAELHQCFPWQKLNSHPRETITHWTKWSVCRCTRERRE